MCINVRVHVYACRYTFTECVCAGVYVGWHANNVFLTVTQDPLTFFSGALDASDSEGVTLNVTDSMNVENVTLT